MSAHLCKPPTVLSNVPESGHWNCSCGKTFEFERTVANLLIVWKKISN